MDLIAIIAVFVASGKAGRELWRDRAILSEFGVPKAFTASVALYPLGILGVVILPFLVGMPLSLVLAVVAFAPGLVLSRRATNALQRAGTDRTRRAQDAASIVFACGIGSLLYAAVVYSFAIAASYSSSSVYG